MKNREEWAAWGGLVAVLLTIAASTTAFYINYQKIKNRNWN